VGVVAFTSHQPSEKQITGNYSKNGYSEHMRKNARAPREQRLSTEAQAGELLRQRRKARGLSQQQVAPKLGVTQSRLSELESARAHITLERLIALARLLDLDVVLRDRREPPATDW
jgi:HTH-type transcriptional regulator/antitoxin HipB